jgi:septal ring factor EnvC (AmiA/AmiB activator)
MPNKNQEVLKMAKMKNLFFILLTVATLAGSTFLVGCGGGVDAEQIQQLNDLKAECDALQSQVNAKNDEKSSLQKQIADQEALIKEFQGIQDQMRKNCP